MSLFYFSGIPFDLPNNIQISEINVSDRFKSYYAKHSDGTSISFMLRRIGDNKWTYTGDINITVLQIGDHMKYFSGDVSGNTTTIGSNVFGMENERKNFLFEVFGVTPATPTTNPGDVNLETNRIIGTSYSDRLKGTRKTDEIIGYEGSDIINGKGGDDIIDAGIHTTGRFDKVKGGPGNDTFVIKDNYWTFIKDFNSTKDNLDLSGLSSGWGWEMRRKKTFIFGNDGYEVARLKGQVDLSTADIV